jgi:hypothetical protein
MFSARILSTIPNNPLAGYIKAIHLMPSRTRQHILGRLTVSDTKAVCTRHSDALGHVNGSLIMKELHV